MRQLSGSHHTNISPRGVKNVGGGLVEQLERKHHYGKEWPYIIHEPRDQEYVYSDGRILTK